MKEFILLVKEFEGIFGAVLGSITTLIATDILRKKGNLKVYLMDWKGKYETFKEVGCYMGEKKDTDFYHYTFSYILQVYNRSDIPKIMRNFKIRFLRNGKEVFSMTPDDNSTRKFVNSGYYIDKIEVINVNPKEIQVLKQSGYISYEELKYIENASKVELIYYNEKDKKRTIVLHKDIISTNNYISKS